MRSLNYIVQCRFWSVWSGSGREERKEWNVGKRVMEENVGGRWEGEREWGGDRRMKRRGDVKGMEKGRK